MQGGVFSPQSNFCFATWKLAVIKRLMYYHPVYHTLNTGLSVLLAIYPYPENVSPVHVVLVLSASGLVYIFAFGIVYKL